MVHKAQVAVIGAGQAGLAAAQILLRHGVQILLVDEHRRLGGPVLRSCPCTETEKWPRAVRAVQMEVQRTQNRLTYSPGTQVLGRDQDGSLWIEDSQGRMLAIQADVVLMATGARERVLPFPGWTLPGVISTGAAQIMLKESGVLPAENMLLAGSSPLLYAVGAEVLACRGRMQGIVDQAGMLAGAKLLTAAAAVRNPLCAAMASMAWLIMNRVPVHRQRKILAVRGDRELEEVVTVKLDRQGRHLPGSERIHPAQATAVGHGFVPNAELAAQAGCKLKLDFHPGTWAVKVNKRMQTSIPGIYAAGEITGIGGGGKALVEGQIAAWAVLENLGLCPRAEVDRNLTSLYAKRRRWLAYGRALHMYCRPPGQRLWDLPEETVICRCENVTLGQIKQAVHQGFQTLEGVKKYTRCGMGMCQGRTCQTIISEMLAERFPDVPVQPPSVRMPVKAVSIHNLMNSQ